jgi:hypothetical protein
MHTSKTLLSLFLTIALSLSNSISPFTADELKQNTSRGCFAEITKLEKLIELEKARHQRVLEAIKLQTLKNQEPYSAFGQALIIFVTGGAFTVILSLMVLYEYNQGRLKYKMASKT